MGMPVISLNATSRHLLIVLSLVRLSFTCTLLCSRCIGTLHVKTLSANRWHMGSVPQDCMIVATEAFGAGINEPHETGRAGRDGQPAVCHTLFHRIPSALSPKIIQETGDPSGQMEMREVLQIANCIRLVFQCMDRRSHSCSALPQSELCSHSSEQLEKYQSPKCPKTFLHSLLNLLA
ncbi:hypothetical protein C8R42DRAFT_258377 [Lentinula raphanica]|nr:hypothetical protein C8R42DRAFT_258377 [Lentinula raphanica]